MKKVNPLNPEHEIYIYILLAYLVQFDIRCAVLHKIRLNYCVCKGNNTKGVKEERNPE
jgi:hypothetical protein